MALTKDQMTIVAKAKKWLIAALDPTHYIKMAELEREVQRLAAGYTESMAIIHMLVEAVLKEAGPAIQVNMKAGTIINGSYNSANTELSAIQTGTANIAESVETIQSVNSNSGNIPLSPHSYFANDAEEIEQLRKRFPGRRNEE